MPRDDFSADTKQRLAKRAGYLCSICKQLTIGPSQESERSVNLTGEAAHIASAAPLGRRYDASQTPEERADIENGIWLCANHATLVDRDESTFTAGELKRFKKIHEAKIAFQQQGIHVERGSVTGIDLANFGEITSNISLKFSDRNIILGSNGVGKTLICQMIAALTKKNYLDRWRKYDWDKSNSYCRIEFFRNEPSAFTIAISSKDEVAYSFNGLDTPLLAAPFHVFYLEEDMHDFRHRVNREREDKGEPLLDKHDLLTWLALYFGLTVQEFSNVVNSMKKEKKFFIGDININEERRTLEVCYGTTRGGDFHSFGSYSTGEKQRIILEIALKIATYYARFQTTILLLESTAVATIDDTGLNKLLDIVRQENFGFQFFFTSYLQPEKLEADGYTVYELTKRGKQQGIDATMISGS